MKNSNCSIRIISLLTALLLPGIVSAAILKTTSGKYYRDYKINRITRNKVELIHSDGIIWLEHSELPPHLLRQYAQEIKNQKAIYNRRFEPVIKKKISEALNAGTPEKSVEMLNAIKKYYPDHPLAASIDELISKQQNSLATGKKFASVSGTMDEQISELQLMFENTTDPEWQSKINKRIGEIKDKQKKVAAEIESIIQNASASDDHQEAIKTLKKLLEKYPDHPDKKQQRSYRDKVNQLLSEKENLLENARQQRADRLAAYLQKTPDAESVLQKTFLMQKDYDRLLAEKILQSSTSVASAINTAQQQPLDQAIITLAQALKNSEYAINQESAVKLKEKFERRKASLAAIMPITVETNANGQFIIKKEINAYDDWYILIADQSQFEIVYKISKLYEWARGNLKLRNHYKQQAKDVYKTETWLGFEHCKNKEKEYLEKAADANVNFFKDRDAGDALFRQLQEESREKIKMTGRVCSLSNISKPVVVIVFETFSWQTNKSIFSADKEEVITNFWCQQYSPENGNQSMSVIYGIERH